MRRFFAGAMLAALAVAGWMLAWKFSSDLRLTRIELDVTAAKSAAAERERARLQEQLHAAEADVATARRVVSRPSPAMVLVRPDAPVAPEAQPEYFRRVVEDPAVSQLFMVQQKFQLRQKYDFLLMKLHLAPDRQEEFLRRLVEKRVTAMDVANVAAANGLKPNDPAVLEGFDRANADSDRAIRTLLGDDGFAQYQAYDQNITAWNSLYGVSREIALSGSPLDADQAEALTKILAQPPTSGRAPSDTDAMDAYAASYVEWSANALKQASAVLTPEQLAALKRNLEQTLIAVKLRAALQHPATAHP